VRKATPKGEGDSRAEGIFAVLPDSPILSGEVFSLAAASICDAGFDNQAVVRG